jgi:hypothetical protein
MNLGQLAKTLLHNSGKNWKSQIEAAKFLHKKNPNVFSTVEKARWHARQYFLSKEIEASKKPAKILLFDIETCPVIGGYYSLWNNPPQSMILRDWHILTWSGKWLFEDEVFSMKITKKEILREDDSRIVKGLWKALDEADIVIAHNLKKFDKRVAQTRFFKYDLKFPSHYQVIDTLATARTEFKITSNRLDYIARRFLGIEGKAPLPSGAQLECIGNPFKGIPPNMEMVAKLDEYCDQDVRVLEDVYLFLRGYIKNHPNMALWDNTDSPICKACGHDKFDMIGDYTTIVNTYHGYRCKNCGSVHRSRRPIENSKLCLR